MSQIRARSSPLARVHHDPLEKLGPQRVARADQLHVVVIRLDLELVLPGRAVQVGDVAVAFPVGMNVGYPAGVRLVVHRDKRHQFGRRVQFSAEAA